MSTKVTPKEAMWVTVPVTICPGRRVLRRAQCRSLGVGHHAREQRNAFVDGQRQECHGGGTGQPGGQDGKGVLVDEDAVHVPVRVLPDALHGALGREGAEHRLDVVGQIRPHGDPGPGRDPGPYRVDAVPGEAVPARGALDVHLLQQARTARRDHPAQTGPERVVGRAPHLLDVGLHGVRGGVQALREQPEPPGQRERSLAGPVAADVEVLVPADVDREPVLHLQPAPGAAVTQHGPHQLQPDIERYLGPVVKALRKNGR
ncbi:hypothetical protein ACIPMT_12925 [Streptomyces griseus]|uniref:hypothetical protein n=1 Tax=Streptomyces griseus TaxID=1911 RepID=UPI00380D9F25